MNKKTEPIEQAIKVAGGLAKLASLVGVKPQRLNNWRKRGIPAGQALAIEAATGGAVSRHDLRPDIYPRAA